MSGGAASAVVPGSGGSASREGGQYSGSARMIRMALQARGNGVSSGKDIGPVRFAATPSALKFWVFFFFPHDCVEWFGVEAFRVYGALGDRPSARGHAGLTSAASALVDSGSKGVADRRG